MNRKLTRTLVLLLLSSVMLTSCSGTSTKDLTELPLVDRASSAEIRNYYKEAIKVKDISQMTISPAVETGEFREVSDEEMNILLEELSRVETLISSNTYEQDDYLDTNTYNNLKIFLDDRTYTRSEIVFSGAQREKFTLDVQYIGQVKDEGKVKLDAKYLGVHGIFRKDKDGLCYKDQLYVDKIEKAIKEEQELLAKKQEAGIIDTTVANQTESSTSKVSNTESTSTATPSTTTLTNSNTDTSLDPNLLASFSAGESSTSINVLDLADYGEVNLKVYNNIFGSSLNETAFVPTLDMIFTPSENGSKLGGYGIYKQGSLMGDFGINPKKLNSVVTIRYIFDRDIADETQIKLYGAYVREMEMEGLPEFEDELLPQFVMSSIEQMIDRADRLRNNNDVTGLASGSVYSNLRNTILFGTLNNGTKVNTLSSISRYLSRSNNQYLVEVKSLSEEDNMYDKLGQGRYEDTYLVLLEQQLLDDSFVIIDWVRTNRKFIEEPPFEYTSSIDKRYSYLSLEGTTPDDIKPSIKEFFQTQIENANAKEWTAYYQNINHDTDMLGKTERDSIYLTTKQWCERMGSEKQYQYYGAIVNWIGGTTQVEFTTEELIIYPEINKAQWMTNYYVVSSYEDKWVIDELTNLDMEIIEGDTITKKQQEIESYSAFTTQRTDTTTEATN